MNKKIFHILVCTFSAAALHAMDNAKVIITLSPKVLKAYEKMVKPLEQNRMVVRKQDVSEMANILDLLIGHHEAEGNSDQVTIYKKLALQKNFKVK
ncbi:MAG: hypothetical protein WCE21_05555 [Candidatus Babeliales bacterium]